MIPTQPMAAQPNPGDNPASHNPTLLLTLLLLFLLLATQATAGATTAAEPSTAKPATAASPPAPVAATALQPHDDTRTQGEHARRAGAELMVLRGDLISLTLDAAPDLHKRGLRRRIRGGMAALEILLRYADQETGNPVRSRFEDLQIIYQALDAGEHDTALALIERLVAQYPLMLPLIQINDAKAFEPLHKKLCAACHDVPAVNVERPAYNLFQQAKRVSRQEMFARLLIGVRGDRVTGIDNPLSDIQVLGLLALYSSF